MSAQNSSCPICCSATNFLGTKCGQTINREFHLRQCVACDFRFVENPVTDYAKIYDDAYYRGQGADPLVDYEFEYNHPDLTIRQYEWSGIRSIVSKLAPKANFWLDYGCGNGGLVRHVSEKSNHKISGFDTGAWADRARKDQFSILTECELERNKDTFDVVTAIEVIEHITEPVSFPTNIRNLVKPGALLFMTTQNACNAPPQFINWPYVIPEIHVSLFTPKSLALALEKSGFDPYYPGFTPGWENILRFKILKNLRRTKVGLAESLLPWRAIGKMVDRRYKFTALPFGIAK